MYLQLLKDSFLSISYVVFKTSINILFRKIFYSKVLLKNLLISCVFFFE